MVWLQTNFLNFYLKENDIEVTKTGNKKKSKSEYTDSADG